MHTVIFLDNEPSEKEYFEEYNKYNTGVWFILIFLLRCFAPFCLGLQSGPFQYHKSLEYYIHEFSKDFKITETNHTWDENSARSIVLHQEFEKRLIMRMMLLKYSGFALGALFGGISADIFGRRATSFMVSIVWISLSTVFLTLQTKLMVEIFYMLLSACCSVINVCTFVNFSEISQSKYRVLAIYSLTSYVLADFMVRYIADCLQDWRYFLSFITAVLSCMVFATWYIPESPRWLFNKDRRKDAYQQLNCISGLVYNISCVRPEKSVPKMIIAKDMFLFLFSRKWSHFIICNILIGVGSAHYCSSRLQIILYHLNVDVLKHVENAAEVLGYLFFMPIYLFFGKRNGLFFCFILLALENTIAALASDKDSQVFYDLFAVMAGLTATNFYWLYSLDIFPTFLRATVIGIGFTVYNISVIFVILVTFQVKDLRGLFYHVGFLMICIMGVLVLKLPNKYYQDLPNFKLY